MPKNTRKTISTEALLEMGGINGLLDEVNNGDFSDDGIFGPALILDEETDGQTLGKKDTKEKPVSDTAGNKEIVSGKSKGKSVSKKSREGRAVGSTADKSNIESKPDTPKPLGFSLNSKCSEKEWDEILSMLRDYRHSIDRKNDKVVYIDGELMEVLRPYFGIRTSWLINVLIRIFIKSNKERFKAMQERQSKLLK